MGAMPGKEFQQAIQEAEHLILRAGLSAIAEGKAQIIARDSRRVLGSVHIDNDCRKAHPNSNRWDYAIGYNRKGKPFVFFVEVHSANSHNVAEMVKKLDWLVSFLHRDANADLRRLPREYHWVASGKFNIPGHLPQYRMLQTLKSKRGLQGPHKHLVLQ